MRRNRVTPAVIGGSGLLVSLVLAWAVGHDWSWLVNLDDSSRGWATSGVHHDTWRSVLLNVEASFGFFPVVLYSVALCLSLGFSGYRRAAVFVAFVMVGQHVATTTMKYVVDRDRPPWQQAHPLLTSGSYPSGHASAVAALATVGFIITMLLSRRPLVRRTVNVIAIGLALAVAADRVLLGRHYLTDVVGGLLLGFGVAVTVYAVWSPLPRPIGTGRRPLPHVFSTERRLAVILNPSKVDDPEAFEQLVADHARTSGWSAPRWHYTTVDDSGTGMAEAAAVEGCDLVLVCGGDGTVREVCAELAGTGIPVGIIPAGTGNLLARNLDIPLILSSAIDVALNGQDRAVDLVEVSGDNLEPTSYLVMAGMGFDAALMEGVSPDIKRRAGAVAYVISGLRALRFTPVKVEISIDGGAPTTHHARTIIVGNVGYLIAGMPLLPDASIDDGKLDVVLLYPKGFWSWFPLAARVLAKRPPNGRSLVRFTGRSVVITAATPTPRQLDGDPIGAGRELAMTCVHGKLLVRVPR